MRRSLAAPLLVLCAAVVPALAACVERVSPDAVDSTVDARVDPTAASFGWVTSGSSRLQTGSLDVPLDHDDPSKGTITLHVVRHLADPDLRIGTLLVNPGGPGIGGTWLAREAEGIYTERLLDRFDILAWDPRGTGESDPHIDCIDNYDRYYAMVDLTPDTAEERQFAVDTAREFADACATKNADLLQYVGTNSSARDIDLIRRALGEDTISYFGFSYGSELGAVWSTMFPDTVRAAVLDGAADPNADATESNLQQAAGFEQTLTNFLAWCDTDTSCTFHGGDGAASAFDALMRRLDESPVPSDADRPDVNLAVAITAVVQAMYSDSLWPRLATALHDAEQGHGRGLLSLYDDYLERQPDGTYSNALEAFQVIRCMDTVERPTVAEDDAGAAAFREVSPRLAPGTIGSYFCTFFPPTTDARIAVSGGAPVPILVVGTTGDAATPLESTRAMARTIDGRLVIVTADQHTGYGVNACVDTAVDEYLIDPVGHTPTNGLTCD